MMAWKPARRDLSIILLLFLLGLAVFTAHFLHDLQGRPTYWTDTYEYAQTARTLVDTGRLVTTSAQVLEFKLLYHGSLPLPYFYHDVGNTLLMAAVFRLLGPSDAHIPIASGLLFSLLPPLVFLVARRLGSEGAGLVAAVLTALNPELITFSGTGLSEVPSAFFTTLMLALLLLPRPLLPKGAGAGLVFGALTLLRSSFVACLPWVLAFLWFDGKRDGAPPRGDRGRLAAPALFLAGFCLLALPSAVRSYRASGRPFFAVASYYMPLFATDAIKGKSKTVDSIPGLEVNATDYFVSHPWAFLKKGAWELKRLVQEIGEGGLGVSDPWALPTLLFLYLVSVLAPAGGEPPERRRFRLLVAAMFLTPVAVGLYFQIRLRYLYPFIPVAVAYVGELLVRIKGPSSSRLKAVVTLAMLAAPLTVLPLRWASVEPEDSGIKRDDYLRAVGEFVRHATPRSAVVFSPLLEVKPVAWYARREMVEFNPYTLGILTAEPAREPFFVLLTSGPQGTTLAGEAPQGFSPVASWHSSAGEQALLLKEDERRPSGH